MAREMGWLPEVEFVAAKKEDGREEATKKATKKAIMSEQEKDEAADVGALFEGAAFAANRDATAEAAQA